MTGMEANLANAASLEAYGNVMRSKGLLDRAGWAYTQARNIRQAVLASALRTEKASKAA